MPRRDLGATVARRVTVALIVAHGLGALDVFVLLWWVLPQPAHHDWAGALVANLVAFAVLVPLGMVLGPVLGRRRAAPWRHWLRSERPPSPAEQLAVLREPWRCTTMNATFWIVSAVAFGAINAPTSPDVAEHVVATILMGGLTTCAIGYLLVERLMRPVVAQALSAGPPPRQVAPGVQGRLVLAWLFATGVPLLGLALLGVHILAVGDVSATRAGASVLVLAVAALGVGLVAAVVSARSVADPVCAVRDAMGRLEAGELDVDVAVDDGSEIGLLQSGFNRMAAGLRERERLRDLFGRHVGEEVARAALNDGAIKLGGESREVAVLFVDLVGSTSLAATHQPQLVVALLNRFFAVVVDVIDRHGGWVNKFEGDGAMCIFGAPLPHEDAAGAALAWLRMLLECRSVYGTASLGGKAQRPTRGRQVIGLHAVGGSDLLQGARPFLPEHALERQQLRALLGVCGAQLLLAGAAGEEIVDLRCPRRAARALQSLQQVRQVSAHEP